MPWAVDAASPRASLFLAGTGRCADAGDRAASGSHDRASAGWPRGSDPAGSRAAPHRAAAASPAKGQEGSRVEVGFEERLRQENWNNLLDFNGATPDKRSQFRFRERLWARFNFSGVELALGLNNESRSIFVPDTPFIWDETVVETVYAEYKAKTWSARLGRQNLQRGEGFILFDGTPLDGSRTAYVNALDAAWTPASRGSS